MSQTKVQLVEGLNINTAAPATALQIDSSGNINLDSNTLYVDATNNRVGIGTTSPSHLLDVSASSSGSDVVGRIRNTNADANSDAKLILETPNGPWSLTASRSNGRIDLKYGSSTFTTVDQFGRFLVGTSTSAGLANKTIELAGGGDSGNIGTYQCFNFNAGTAGPAQFDFLKSNSNTIGTNTLVANNHQLGAIRWRGANGSGYDVAAQITGVVDGTPGSSGDMPGRLVFSTTADGASSPTERMRINSNGNILIGTTTENGRGLTLWSQFSGSSGGIAFSKNNDGNANACAFINAGSVIGTISYNTTSTAYNTSSDYRLKENITTVTDGITRLQQLKPSRFNFIADPDKTVDGFIAHEVQAVVPEAINGEKDAVDDDGNPIYQGIDQSKLVPLLTAALQEALAEIESLKVRVTALEP